MSVCLVTPYIKTYKCQADLHESFITDRGTLLVTRRQSATEANLSIVGGRIHALVFECLIFEVDPEKGHIQFLERVLSY